MKFVLDPLVPFPQTRPQRRPISPRALVLIGFLLAFVGSALGADHVFNSRLPIDDGWVNSLEKIKVGDRIIFDGKEPAFKVLEVLGSGGFGIAFKVDVDGQTLVLKVGLSQPVSSPPVEASSTRKSPDGFPLADDRIHNQFHSLENQAKTLQRLREMGIPAVEVHEFPSHGRYLLMEYADGRNAHQRLSIRPLEKKVKYPGKGIEDAAQRMHDVKKLTELFFQLEKQNLTLYDTALSAFNIVYQNPQNGVEGHYKIVDPGGLIPTVPYPSVADDYVAQNTIELKRFVVTGLPDAFLHDVRDQDGSFRRHLNPTEQARSYLYRFELRVRSGDPSIPEEVRSKLLARGPSLDAQFDPDPIWVSEAILWMDERSSILHHPSRQWIDMADWARVSEADRAEITRRLKERGQELLEPLKGLRRIPGHSLLNHQIIGLMDHPFFDDPAFVGQVLRLLDSRRALHALKESRWADHPEILADPLLRFLVDRKVNPNLDLHPLLQNAFHDFNNRMSLQEALHLSSLIKPHWLARSGRMGMNPIPVLTALFEEGLIHILSKPQLNSLGRELALGVETLTPKELAQVGEIWGGYLRKQGADLSVARSLGSFEFLKNLFPNLSSPALAFREKAILLNVIGPLIKANELTGLAGVWDDHLELFVEKESDVKLRAAGLKVIGIMSDHFGRIESMYKIYSRSREPELRKAAEVMKEQFLERLGTRAKVFPNRPLGARLADDSQYGWACRKLGHLLLFLRF